MGRDDKLLIAAVGACALVPLAHCGMRLDDVLADAGQSLAREVHEELRETGQPAKISIAGSDVISHDIQILAIPVLADDGFRIELFDAAEVGKGPVATLAAENHTMAFIIHSSWMPSASETPKGDRIRFSEDFTDAQLASIPGDLQEAVKEVAREIDEEMDAL